MSSSRMPWTTTGTASMQAESRILNFDYCGNCHGKCRACLLSEEERKRDVPFLNQKQIGEAVTAAARLLPRSEFLAVGIGRGNTLTLRENSVDDIAFLASRVRDELAFDRGILEVSTSLVGRLEDQIERANEIEARVEETSGLETRFVVVINPALSSEGYWRLLCDFFDAMEQRRSPHSESPGDIAVVNLSADALPEPSAFAHRMAGWHFPVNVAWVGGVDEGMAGWNAIDQVGRWFADFYENSVRLGLDCSLISRAQNALAATESGGGLSNLQDMADAVSESLVFVDHMSQVHRGAFTLLGDMDPMRFPLGGKEVSVAPMLRNRSCRACPYLAACVHAGGAHLFTANTLAMEGSSPVCMTGLKPVFEKADLY